MDVRGRRRALGAARRAGPGTSTDTVTTPGGSQRWPTASRATIDGLHGDRDPESHTAATVAVRRPALTDLERGSDNTATDADARRGSSSAGCTSIRPASPGRDVPWRPASSWFWMDDADVDAQFGTRPLCDVGLLRDRGRNLAPPFAGANWARSRGTGTLGRSPRRPGSGRSVTPPAGSDLRLRFQLRVGAGDRRRRPTPWW
mgnify:CR=1 FL=1